jgi:hypothetical protein
MKNKVFLFILLAWGALLLSACTVNFHTVINKDGSGDWITEMGFTKSDQESLQSFGYANIEAYCNEAAADLPDNATMTIEQRGEETYCVFTASFASLEELRQAYAETDGLTINRLEIVDGVLYYDIAMDMSSDSGDLDSALSTTWMVTMPGTIQNHNAPQIEGNKLIWPLASGQVVSIQAQSKISGFALTGDTTTWITVALGCLCCLIILIVVAVVVFLVVRNKRQAIVAEQSTAAPPA